MKELLPGDSMSSNKSFFRESVFASPLTSLSRADVTFHGDCDRFILVLYFGAVTQKALAQKTAISRQFGSFIHVQPTSGYLDTL